MPITPDQSARLAAIRAGLTGVVTTATTMGMDLAALQEELEQPDEPEEPAPDPTVYPSGGTWAQKRAFIEAHAGARSIAPDRVVASAADLSRLQLPGSWATNGTWTLDKGLHAGLHDLDVRGIIYYKGADPLNLLHVSCMGVQRATTVGVSTNGWIFDHVTVTGPPSWVTPGQGALHMASVANWLVDHCLLQGFVDGMQVSADGLIVDSVRRAPLYSSFGGGTHGDGIQNYGGTVRADRNVFDLRAPGGPAESQNRTNGAFFCSDTDAFFVANELIVQMDPGENLNVLHAGSAPATIEVNGGYLIGGRLIGGSRVKLTNVEHVSA